MRIVTGIRPLGKFHIGNYLNTVKQYEELQEKNECIFFIANLHGLTTPFDPKDYPKEVMEKTVEVIASGLNPEKCIICLQSDIKEVTELAWILSSVTPVGDLQRMTQFKEKSKKQIQNINAGLLNYPILMASDILIYQADRVPVGKDQEQHVELARTIARKFNKSFGETFKEPKALILDSSAKIMSLQEPTKKMSKSDSPQTQINIFDEPEDLKRKIMSAVTDNQKTIKYSPEKKPGISNLLTIYSLFSSKSIKQVEAKFKKKGYADFKKALAQLMIEKLEPMRRKRKELLAREDYLKDILEKGAKRARTLAQETMTEVRKKTGLS